MNFACFGPIGWLKFKWSKPKFCRPIISSLTSCISRPLLCYDKRWQMDDNKRKGKSEKKTETPCFVFIQTGNLTAKMWYVQNLKSLAEKNKNESYPRKGKLCSEGTLAITCAGKVIFDYRAAAPQQTGSGSLSSVMFYENRPSVRCLFI